MKSQPHIFGIRHHGPGSAKRLRAALEQLEPDYLLIEGPPEGTELLQWIGHPDLRTPVAMLVYEPKSLEKAAFYPYARFSPEWQAIQFARQLHIPTGFMDLSPNWYWKDEQIEQEQEFMEVRQSLNPLGDIAHQAGFQDGESWWEEIIENKAESGDIFPSLTLLMGVVRKQEKFHQHVDQRTLRREAWMRQEIRRIQKSGFKKIAVVCGAFHAPALTELGDVKGDKALLKGMKKRKTRSTWIPWTYERLSYQSGYGAGVISPQWYSLLFDTEPKDRIIQWMSLAAELLRKEGLDASPAQVVEGVRLTQTLSTLRVQGSPRLTEMWDALETVFCPGDQFALQLIEDNLIIGNKMGTVPETVPSFPLQQDILQLQKQLRLKPSPASQLVELDLRKAFHRKKSQFLHRLSLLGVEWGEIEEPSRRDLGTFWERWNLRWRPECELQILSAASWGNTVHRACLKKLRHQLGEKHSLQSLTQLLETLLKAGLSELVPAYSKVLGQKIALDKDMQHLMGVLPPLVGVMRYGDVRKTHLRELQPVVEGLLPRVIIGLPEACRNLGTELAEAIYPLLFQAHSSIQILSEFETLPNYLLSWQRALEKLATTRNIHPKLAGTAIRLLFDFGTWDLNQTEKWMMQTLTPGTEAEDAAMWVEGFLSGSGLLLVHHHNLWQLLDQWISTLSEEVFMNNVPLLRRTFSQFSHAERRQIGQLAKGGEHANQASAELPLQMERVKLIQPVWEELIKTDAPDEQGSNGLFST